MGDVVVQELSSGRVEIRRLLRLLTLLWLLVTPVVFVVALWVGMPVPDRSAEDFCTGGGCGDRTGPSYGDDVRHALLWAGGLAALAAVAGPLGLARMAARHAVRGAARSYRVLAAAIGAGVVLPLIVLVLWLTR